jgi:hypothetical protein
MGPEADRRGPWNSEPDFHTRDLVSAAQRGGGPSVEQQARHAPEKK